jgi:hypothetical protein
VKEEKVTTAFPDGNLPLSFQAPAISGELATALQGEGERGLRVLSTLRRGDAVRGRMVAERAVREGDVVFKASGWSRFRVHSLKAIGWLGMVS